MVFNDDTVYIPSQYCNFVEVFRKTNAETLQPHWSVDHPINLELGYTLLHCVMAARDSGLGNGYFIEATRHET